MCIRDRYEQDGKVLVYGFDFLVAGGAYYFINNLVSERNRVHINIPEEGIYESPTPEQANNFILFIGDGMGQNHIKLLEAINPRIVNKTYDYFTARHFPNQGLSMTYAANNPVTDSAAGGTALATGYKTNKYFVGLDPNKNVIMNLCELAQSKDMKTAVLTTDSLQGATPAAFSSHVEHRDMAEEIRAQQLTSGIDYIIGDITEDTYVSTLKSAFETINVGENGFFMMYEEAHIDKESHNRNLVSTYEKMVRANNEINYIMSFIMYHPDTLLIITADHETGGLTYDEPVSYTHLDVYKRQAKSQGRLSFNPLAHLDPVGTIMLLLVGFGWAKPVQINPNRFKKVKLGIIVTALAGPLSNFILSFICAIIYSLFYLLYVVHSIEILFYIALLFMVTGSLSLGLGIFNLIPVPPLDGSRVLAECLPPKARYKYYQLERYSMIIFIGLLILLRTTNILGAIHTPIWEFFENIGISLFSWML